MNEQALPLPIVRPLPRDFSLTSAFARCWSLPGCLWLDSASRGPRWQPASSIWRSSELGRYSFLTADPIETLVASPGDPDPWPQLEAWCRRLARLEPVSPPAAGGQQAAGLPPFQGGIAGMIGYEAGAWLEPVGRSLVDDLPTAALSLGLYDWTIAQDHERGRSWIISQGLPGRSDAQRLQLAQQRADQVQAWLSDPAMPRWASQSERQCDPHIAASQHTTAHDAVLSNFSGDGFRAAVAQIVESIRAGDSFQVNLAQRLLCRAHLSSPELYVRLRAENPAPFAAYYAGEGFEVLSSSPEGFLRVRDRLVETRPIKGTVPRTGEPATDDSLAAQLAQSEKDHAENVMIVDLMRNDLSRVCTDDSVLVRQLCEIERYQYVQHLVSVVQGQLRDDATVADLLHACFPGGSVSGAPKIEAMRTIARLEPNRRGPYCGSIGYISCTGDADFNILIRTITAAHGYWQLPVGGGITANSDPAGEEAETWAKAEGMLRAIAAVP